MIPSAGILLSFFALLFAIKTIRDNTNVAKANYEFQITLSHRDAWRYITERGLSRIKSPVVDVNTITEEERINTNFILLHVRAMFNATKTGVLSDKVSTTMLMMDVGEFFSLPIPSRIWNDAKPYHPDDFQNFMNKCIAMHSNNPTANTSSAVRFKNAFKKIATRISLSFSNLKSSFSERIKRYIR